MNLLSLMRAAGLKQREIAVHIGTKECTVSHYVRGRRAIGYPQAVAIRELLARRGVACEIEHLMKPQAEKPPEIHGEFKIPSTASRMVKAAIDAGALPSLRDGATKCTDCDRPADRYDHRNYAQPLLVEPVCARCNALRGPAVFVLPKAA